MKKILRFTMIAAAAAILLFAAAALAAGDDPAPGGQGDPLVTLSYLEKVYTDYISDLLRQDMEAQAQAIEADLEQRIAALEEASREARAVSASTFQLVTLEAGQILSGDRGIELILRIGEVSVSAQNSPGLVDTTTGGSLEDGQGLEKNHLYMITIPDNGIRAKDHAVLLVRGAYVIN